MRTELGIAAAALCAVTWACGKTAPSDNQQPSSDTHAPRSNMTASHVNVTFSMSPVDGGLAVSYQLDNGRAEPIWVLDQTLGKKHGAWVTEPNRAVVSRGSAAESHFVLGFLTTDSQMPDVEQGVATELPPGARLVGAGATVQGTFRVPLPLAPWHPYLKMARLGNPDNAVLRVGYLAQQPRWTIGVALPKGVRVPDVSFVTMNQRWATSAKRSLPR